VGQRLMRAGTERILETGCDCPERQCDWQVEQDAVNEGVRKIRGESAPDQRLSDARTKVPCRQKQGGRDASDQREPHGISPSIGRSAM